MKAIDWTEYGSPDVLTVKEAGKPVPKENEIRIKIHAATVTAGDCEMRSLQFPLMFRIPIRLIMGITRPKDKIPGQELAGEVESVGKEVTKFRKGDRIFAATGMHLGAYAQYVCLPETYPMSLIPDNMNYEEAATIPTGGINGLHFIRKAKVQTGDQVLINGAGGSIGTYAIQIAKVLGAEVTAVDSTKKLDMLRSIGADYVIDYTKEDFTRIGETYDVIVDVVGKSSFSRSIQCLKKEGRYVLGNPKASGMLRGLWTSKTTDKKVLFELAGYKSEDMKYLKELIEDGKVKSIIDKRYPLEQVAEAQRYVEGGNKQGNVVVTVEH